MNKITDELYERFKKNLESVNGTCVRTSKENLGKAVAGIFTEAGIPDTCIVETPLMKEGGVISALEEAGIKVYTDHIRLNAETVKGGVPRVSMVLQISAPWFRQGMLLTRESYQRCPSIILVF